MLNRNRWGGESILLENTPLKNVIPNIHLRSPKEVKYRWFVIEV